jgi:glutaconyl-CoA/methylmalonyl-CoA decarboxylase subunit gamma
LEEPGPLESNAVTEGNVPKYEITVDGKTYTVEVGDVGSSPVDVIVDGQHKTVAFAEMTQAQAPAPNQSAGEAQMPAAEPAAEPAPAAPQPSAGADGQVVRAPMPGKILSVSVAVGDSITEGDTFCTLEAMKMEMPVSSTASGTVTAIHVAQGSNVANDDPLITVE